jgi:TfoX/Sxy family transcriptional regulator of competence genes
MATDREFLDYVVEQIDLGGRLTHKRLFGEFALYVDEKVVAFVCDNSVFFKPSQADRRLAPTCRNDHPIPAQATTRLPMNCWTIPMQSAR